MNKQTANNLFILSSIPRLYQRLTAGMASYQEFGDCVLREIKAAHAFRHIEQVEELSKILLNIPIEEYRLIAQYYLIWCQQRKTNYHAEELERIIEQTQTYKTKALFSRGAIEWYRGNSESALYFYTEALNTSPSASDYVELIRSIAVLKSTEGFHKSALSDLESMIPLLKHAEPRLYFDYLNSYAVELGEVGRDQEAHNIMQHVLASPFAPAYPEWRETSLEVNQRLYKRRSSVTVPTPKPQPEVEKPEVEKPQPKAKVLAFPKREVPADDIFDTLNKLDTISFLNPLQLLGVILKVVLKERITYAEIDRICTAYYQAIQDYYAE